MFFSHKADKWDNDETQAIIGQAFLVWLIQNFLSQAVIG